MLTRDCQTRTNGRGVDLGEQARALAVVLHEEFGVAFTFYCAATGELVDGPESDGSSLHPDEVARLAADGRARVTPRGHGRYQVALLLHAGGRPVLVAGAELAGLAASGPDVIREQTRLQRWAQSVGDRLRLADQLVGQRHSDETQGAQVTAAWETVLTLDHLVRRLRIHKDQGKNQQRILEAAFGLLSVQAVAWVPTAIDQPVRIQGESPLSPADCRRLAAAAAVSPEFRAPGPLVCNRVQETPWGASFPNVISLLAFPVTDQGPAGWVLAINKHPGSWNQKLDGKAPIAMDSSLLSPSSFGRSDAARLTPFVALLELHVRSASRYQDLKDLLVGLTRSLTSALDAKDSYTYGHSERVARIAIELGRELGLSEDDLGDIYLAGLLHDVGKIGIRDAVLSKADPLTPEEFEHIKQHVTIGYKILADLRPIRNLLPGVLYHHERWDGQGYPDGLAGEEIPLLARILAVADAYDAMSTARPYRDAMPCRRVEEVLAAGASTQWDRRIIEVFQRCRHRIHAIRQRGVGDSLSRAIDGALRADQHSSWAALVEPAELGAPELGPDNPTPCS